MMGSSRRAQVTAAVRSAGAVTSVSLAVAVVALLIAAAALILAVRRG